MSNHSGRGPVDDDSHLRIEAALLRHVADPATDLKPDGRSVPQHVPTVGGQRAQYDTHRGRLAGSVAPDKTEHLAWTDRQVQVADGYKASVGLPDASELKARRRHAYNPASTSRSAAVYVSSAARPRLLSATVVRDATPLPVFSVLR
jgi:purine nucleoside permease